MKIRTDFVTNSSSSSFVIVGIDDKDTIKKLAIAEEKDEIECSYGVDYGKIVNFYGYYDDPYYAGMDIETLIETMTLPEIKKHFVKLVKDNFNIEINEYDVSLHYGEVGE